MNAIKAVDPGNAAALMSGPREQAGAGFRRLTLTNFRSYGYADIRFDGRPVTFAGPNGAGKTNLLEAISLLGPGRGLRGAKLVDMVKSGGAASFSIAARIDDQLTSSHTLEPSGGGELPTDSFEGSSEDSWRVLGVGIEQAAGGGTTRLCRIDGASARGPIAFADIVRLLWLTPAQDGLFTGPAGDRRRFLDRIAQTHSVGHAKAGAEFETALRQRQKLLEAGRYDEGWLSAIEAQLAEAAVAVATARREAAAILASFDVSSLAGGAFPSAEIVLEGDLESALEGSPITDVEDWYQTELSRRRPMDAEAGRTTLGPHKSDLVVRYRAKDTLAKHASTGEQKALLIGLILANACALAGRAQTTPLVLLFDEIAAHLDPDRRAALFDILGGLGHQCFMTGTDDTLFAAWGDRAQGFRVDEGAVTAL